MKNKGFTLVELIAAIAIIGALIGISTAAFIRVRENILESQYANVVSRIENSAVKYARDLNGISDYNITVEYLISEGYITADDETNIYNPKDNSTMNCYMIHVKYNGNDYEATLGNNQYNSETKECNNYNLYTGKFNILCKKDGDSSFSSCSDDWIKTNKLTLKHSAISTEEQMTAEYKWTSTRGDYSEVEELVINNINVINNVYKLSLKSELENTYEATQIIRVDNEAPAIINARLLNKSSSWISKNILAFDVDDKNGSGVYGFRIFDSASSITCPTTGYTENNNYKIEITLNGNYQICVIDKVGNVTKSPRIFNVTNIDSTPPEVSITTTTGWAASNRVTINITDDHDLAGYAIEDESGKMDLIKVSGTSISLNKTYTKNGTYKVYVVDQAGNVNDTQTITIDNIDSNGPSIDIISNLPESSWGTSARLSITITDDDSGIKGYKITTTEVTPTSWNNYANISSDPLLNVYENKTLYVYAIDNANNITHTKIKITNIDTDAPTYSSNIPETWITGSRSITITADDATSGVKQITVWYVDSDNTTKSKTVNGNSVTITSYSEKIQLKITDNAGNEYSNNNITTYVDNTAPYTMSWAIEKSFESSGDIFTCERNELRGFEDNVCIITVVNDPSKTGNNWYYALDSGSGVKYFDKYVYRGGTLIHHRKEDKEIYYEPFDFQHGDVEVIYLIDAVGNTSAALRNTWYFNS